MGVQVPPSASRPQAGFIGLGLFCVLGDLESGGHQVSKRIRSGDPTSRADSLEGRSGGLSKRVHAMQGDDSRRERQGRAVMRSELSHTTHSFRLDADAFDVQCCCLGDQVAKVVAKIGEVLPELQCYMADVEFIGAPPIPRSPTPALVGDADDLACFATPIEQFVSGVFVGVPAHITEPQFREGGLWTEDGETAELGDAMVEVRTFDFSCIVVVCDETHFKSLRVVLVPWLWSMFRSRRND